MAELRMLREISSGYNSIRVLRMALTAGRELHGGAIRRGWEIGSMQKEPAARVSAIL